MVQICTARILGVGIRPRMRLVSCLLNAGWNPKKLKINVSSREIDNTGLPIRGLSLAVARRKSGCSSTRVVKEAYPIRNVSRGDGWLLGEPGLNLDFSRVCE